jgi:TRAP-type C4-dicarboxylate transport system permease small subunit
VTSEGPALPGPLATLRKVDATVQKVEVAVCLGALGVMVVLAFVQVFLRFLQGSALGAFVPDPVAWFDAVARHMVIWVGVLGASLATAEGRHISIEAVPKFLSPRGRRVVEVLVGVASLLVTVLLLVLCWIYLEAQHIEPWLRGEGEPLFVIRALDLHVPRWAFLAVVPVALALMGLRFGVRGLEALLLDDQTFAALREADEQRDMQALEASQEDLEVELLLDHERRRAIESGEAPALDEASAREEVRGVMKSGPMPAMDLLVGDDSEDDDDAGTPGRRPPYKPPSMRSTAEIEAYHPQALHDDEDKADPEMRRGELVDHPADLIAPEVSDEEMPIADLALQSDDAEEVVEALADSERRRQVFEGSSDDGVPLPPTSESSAVTQRVDVELPPQVLPGHLVVVVRPREEPA